MRECEGKTLRDEMAMAALVGLLADPEMDGPPMAVARICYDIADAMLAERSGCETLPITRGKASLRSVDGAG